MGLHQANGFAHIDMVMKILSSCPWTCLHAHGANIFSAKNLKSHELWIFEIEKLGYNANYNYANGL